MSVSSTRNSTSNRAADVPLNGHQTHRWSDDSSEESEDSDNVDDKTHTTQHSASTHQKKDPLFKDSFSLSVSRFPDAWKSSVDRYDIPCNAIEDHFEEYENAVTGAYLNNHYTVRACTQGCLNSLPHILLTHQFLFRCCSNTKCRIIYQLSHSLPACSHTNTHTRTHEHTHTHKRRPITFLS